MTVELIIPEVGESITEVQVGTWLKSVGDFAETDEGLVEIDTDKVSFELPAPIHGRITKILKDAGVAKDPEVRRALNKDFADYLKNKGKYQPEPSATTSFWRTFDRVAGPLGTAGARVMVQRLMEAEQSRAVHRTEMRERNIARAEAKRQAQAEKQV